MNRMMLFDPAGAMRQGMEQGRQTRIGRLAGEAYNAPVADRQNALGRLASTDAGAAFSVEQGLGNQDDQRAQSLGNMSRMLIATPPEMRASLYQSRLLPQLRQFGIEAPEEYGPIVEQTAQQLAASFQDQGTVPAGLREFQGMTKGLSEEEVDRARRISLGLEGRASSAGFRPVTITGSDGRDRTFTFSGRDGSWLDAQGNPASATEQQQIQRQETQPQGVQRTMLDSQGQEAGGPDAMVAAIEQDIGRPLTPQERQQVATGQFNIQAPTQLAVPPQFAAEFNEYRASQGQPPASPDELQRAYSMFNTPAQPAEGQLALQRASGGDVYAQAPMGSGGVNPFVGRSAEQEAAAVRRAQLQADEQFRPAPQGYQWADEARTQLIPIEGGAVAAARDEAAEKARLRQETVGTAARTVVEDIGRALELNERNPRLTSGPVARFRPGLGTPADQMQQLVESVASNIGINQLQQMRESSPTGGALGQVPFQQQQRLEQLLGSLDITQPGPVLQDNLKRVQNIYLDIIHGTGNGPERARLTFDEMGRKYEGPQRWTGDPQIMQYEQPQDDAAELLRKYGIE